MAEGHHAQDAGRSSAEAAPVADDAGVVDDEHRPSGLAQVRRHDARQGLRLQLGRLDIEVDATGCLAGGAARGHDLEDIVFGHGPELQRLEQRRRDVGHRSDPAVTRSTAPVPGLCHAARMRA